MKALKGIEHHINRLAVFHLTVRGSQGGIDIIAAQFFHTHPAGLEFKVALEETSIGAADIEQRINRFVWDVIGDITHGNWRSIAAQLYLLVVPIAHTVDINLSEDIRLLAEDAVEFLIGSRTQFWVTRLGVAHQAITGQALLFTFNLDMELKPVG